MSGKQHKRLRKVAVGFAATLEEAGRKIDKVAYDVIQHRAHGSPMSVSPQDAYVDELLGFSQSKSTSSESRPRAEPQPVQLRKQLLVRKDSLRGIIKQLKRSS